MLNARIQTQAQPQVQTTGAQQAGSEETRPVDDKPRSAYEMVTRQMLEDLKADVAEIKGRINTLLWLLAGAMLLDLLMRAVK